MISEIDVRILLEDVTSISYHYQEPDPHNPSKVLDLEKQATYNQYKGSEEIMPAGGTFEASASMIPFGLIDKAIMTACELVDTQLACTDLSNDRKDLIGCYLAAHFVTISRTYQGGKGQLVEKEIGGTTEKYESHQKAMAMHGGEIGLNATPYGQQALVLDTSGMLAKATTINLPAEIRVY